jgi:3',5'-cyclic AMP phosphodiesterase CpdA
LLIAQITDLHIGFDRDNPDEYNMQRLKSVIARLVDAPNTPDMLLMTGDLTEFGDAASFAALAEAVSQCPFPVWTIPGNHDLREELLAAFPDTPVNDGFIQYALEWNDVRVLMLDTLEEGRHGGAFCGRRAAWLSAELTAHPDTPTVVVMHHPPFESGICWLDSDAREPWIGRFAEAIKGHGQVKSILAGHLHRNIHTLWNGASLTVSASTAPLVGLDLRPIDPDLPDGRAMITDELPVYALHRWDGERLISHFEGVSGHPVFARFDEKLQQVVKAIESERPKG